MLEVRSLALAATRPIDARIEELAKGKATIVVVSHDLQLMKKLCRRLVLLHGGEVLANGAPDSVVTRYLTIVGLEGSAVIQGAFSLKSGSTQNTRRPKVLYWSAFIPVAVFAVV